MGITSQQGFQDVDGLIGFAPLDGDGSDAGHGMSLYSKFYDQKIIPKKEFSFYMADEQHQSVVNLGGRDSSLMKDGDKSKIYYLDLINY